MRDPRLEAPSVHDVPTPLQDDLAQQLDATSLQVVKETDALWRVTFKNPPINMIDYAMLLDLRRLFDEVESGNGPSVLLFESADPDFFLAHYDVSGENLKRMASLTAGPSGLDPWLDLLVRLTRLPAVTISAIRGRARMAGSEFVLATDIRFASR